MLSQLTTSSHLASGSPHFCSHERSSHKPSSRSTFCTSATTGRSARESIRSRKVHSGRLRRSHEVAETCCCEFRTTVFVCATPSRTPGHAAPVSARGPTSPSGASRHGAEARRKWPHRRQTRSQLYARRTSATTRLLAAKLRAPRPTRARFPRDSGRSFGQASIALRRERSVCKTNRISLSTSARRCGRSRP